MTDTLATPGSLRLPKRQLYLVIAALMLGMFLAALDQTVVSTALPTIVGDLHGGSHLTWVITAYLLSSTVSTPLWGKLGDLYGRKGFFQAGHRHLPGGLDPVRAQPFHARADRVPLPAGTRWWRPDGRGPDDRRRRRLAPRTGPLHGPVHGHVRRDDRHRAADRGAVRRVRLLALDLLHQRADRGDRPVRHRGGPAERPHAAAAGSSTTSALRCSLRRRRRSSSSPVSGGTTYAWGSPPMVDPCRRRGRAQRALRDRRAAGDRTGDPAPPLHEQGLHLDECDRFRGGFRHVRGVVVPAPLLPDRAGDQSD